MRFTTSSMALAAIPAAVAQQSVYGQCGGMGWTGATTCAAGSACVAMGQYYSQCVPGAAPSTMVTSRAPGTTSRAPGTSVAPTTTVTKPTTTVAGGGTPQGTGPGTTLQSGYFWVRAVEDPNFHKYLQTNPEYATGTAILSDPSTAGQFNIVDGQLVELVDPATGKLLYANVSPRTDPTESTLPVSFSTTPNTYGTFALTGDELTWSIPSITRQNTGAWYVCTGQQLFINLGAYLYMTPPNCADETIHAYGGATANS